MTIDKPELSLTILDGRWVLIRLGALTSDPTDLIAIPRMEISLINGGLSRSKSTSPHVHYPRMVVHGEVVLGSRLLNLRVLEEVPYREFLIRASLLQAGKRALIVAFTMNRELSRAQGRICAHSGSSSLRKGLANYPANERFVLGLSLYEGKDSLLFSRRYLTQEGARRFVERSSVPHG